MWGLVCGCLHGASQWPWVQVPSDTVLFTLFAACLIQSKLIYLQLKQNLQFHNVLFILLLVYNTGACPDGYLYTLQPPENIVCDPYLSEVLKLDCAITGPNDIVVQWYFSTNDDMDILSPDTLLITNSSKHTLTPMSIENGVRLGLTIHNLSEANEGLYWCQGLIMDGSFLLSASASFTLNEPEFYEFLPFICHSGFLRDSESRCATIMEIPTLPPLTTHLPGPTPSPSMSISPAPSSSLQNMATNLQTSQPLLRDIQVTVSSQPLSPTPELPTAPTQSSTSDSPHSESNTMVTTDSNTEESPKASSSQSSDIILYTILGLLGLLVILCLILGVVIFFLCRKRRRRVDLEGKQSRLSTSHMKIRRREYSLCECRVLYWLKWG